MQGLLESTLSKVWLKFFRQGPVDPDQQIKQDLRGCLFLFTQGPAFFFQAGSARKMLQPTIIHHILAESDRNMQGQDPGKNRNNSMGSTGSREPGSCDTRTHS